MSLITDTQQKLGVEFRLRGFIKAELFTDEQAAAMYAAGFRWILVGFESGHPRILENIRKKAARDDNTRCMDIARRHNLKVKALMSIGHPGESEETIRATRDWLVEVVITSYSIHYTKLYDAFIRTTDPQHKSVVQRFLQELFDKKLIYKDSYTGWYCTFDERFWTDKDVENGLCPDCKRPIERLSEHNYFFT